MDEGIIIEQNCQNCLYYWKTDVCTINELLQMIGWSHFSKIGDIMRSLDTTCPECGSNKTVWSFAVLMNEDMHSEYDKKAVEAFLMSVNKVFRETRS